VIECVPAVRVEIVSVAMPALRFAVPSAVPPSEKTTEPVGILTGEEAVAVKVTTLCANTGFGDAVTPTAGAILLTVIERVTSAAA
jgi:hypothetical protein